LKIIVLKEHVNKAACFPKIFNEMFYIYLELEITDKDTLEFH